MSLLDSSNYNPGSDQECGLLERAFTTYSALLISSYTFNWWPDSDTINVTAYAHELVRTTYVSDSIHDITIFFMSKWMVKTCHEFQIHI